MTSSTSVISVFIQTYNSERYLRQVLETVRCFDEIVICDMHSTDSTIAIAEEFGCKIVYTEKIDICEPARNVASLNASHEWILLVDSDELITPALKDYLYGFISKKTDIDALFIPRKNYAWGKFMHGDYPNRVLRFFRKDKIDWPPYVHMEPHVDGKIMKISGSRNDLAIIHLYDYNVSGKLDKINLYAEHEIEKRKDENFSIAKAAFSSVHRFIKAYFLKGGFRDGKAGFVYAVMESIYKFISIAKIWENNYRQNTEEKSSAENKQ